MNSQSSRGRLAPSPTGGLHVGHARTFLIAWIEARQSGGTVVLRIEDLDPSRVRIDAIPAMVEDLRWLGLDWDEGPYVQSERMSRYYAAIDELKAKELIYPCVCSRADIARASSAPHAEDEGPTYPGTCSAKRVVDAASYQGSPFAWRFRVSAGPVDWNDAVLGPQSIDPSVRGGDFIVAREQHGPSYQLAVVHDDATMEIDSVIRGDDLLTSTPRQILLYRALGYPLPRFGHVPLVLDPSGKRLAKRDESLKLANLREAGVPSTLLIERLAQSIGIVTRAAHQSPADLIGSFEMEKLPKTPWVFDPEILKC